MVRKTRPKKSSFTIIAYFKIYTSATCEHDIVCAHIRINACVHINELNSCVDRLFAKLKPNVIWNYHNITLNKEDL